MPQPNFFSGKQSLPLPVAEQYIDLNDQLVKNKAHTFLMRVHSNAMKEAGIHTGDVVLVDRMMKPQNGSVVIAAIQGDLVIRRYEKNNNGLILLVPASNQLSSIHVNETSAVEIWGVVTYVIRSL